MTSIDAHHHLWDLSRRAQTWLDASPLHPIRRDFTVADLTAAVAGSDIDRTVLVQVLADIDETREFLELADGCALTAAVVGWAELTSPRVAEDLEHLRAGRGGHLLAGIRHLVQAEQDPEWLTRPEVVSGLKAVAAQGLAYDLLVLPHHLPAAVAAVRAVPELTFVLDHLAKPPIASGRLEPWAGMVAELAAEPNVFCKLSGMVTEADPASWTVDDLRPYGEVVLDAFGASRVMFGSDWPVCLVAGEYGTVVAAARELTAGLSGAEREAVFGGTASFAYRLEGRER
ncbi:MAG: amidohydrolase family protein [Streptomyces sp.]|nr:amidohydrolase family protein [Streptomyces sp.]